jgi:predicted PurR-regulated permease PerM
MGFRKYAALTLIVLAIAAMFRDFFVTILLIGLALTILWIIVRFLADFYWKGKDKGEW